MTYEDFEAEAQSAYGDYLTEVFQGMRAIDQQLGKGLLGSLFAKAPDGRFPAKVELVRENSEKHIQIVESICSKARALFPDRVRDIDAKELAIVDCMTIDQNRILVMIYALVEDDIFHYLDDYKILLRDLADLRSEHAERIGYSYKDDKAVVHNTNNNITGSTIYGSVQQGSPGATFVDMSQKQMQDTLVSIDNAVTELESDSDSMEKFQLLRDLERLRAELSSKAPSAGLISKFADSIKGVAEGVAANVLSPSAALAIQNVLMLLPH